ncbi:hypothetical protein EPJ72_12555 [Brachyspira pilosicoli]|uniref:Formyl transferase N-terminal domain-containing protein n=2 Tax=Brachyspira pilosicoli TaxID=52584 RepID=A0A5C8EEY0_BRAPL|nr:hypothetical protein EPJ72_12555 [Brachyspira pilosicoli]
MCCYLCCGKTKIKGNYMKIGIIFSGAGYGVYDALNILLNKNLLTKNEIKILVSRNCIAYERAIKENFTVRKIDFMDRDVFCIEAYNYFKDCNFVILNFGKIVTSELYSKIFTVNLHPSILPSFKGANPLEDQLKNNVKFSGVTMHMVNGILDSGKIISQCIIPVPYNSKINFLKKVYYLGNCYNVLLIFDLMSRNYISVDLENDNFEYNTILKFNTFSNPCLINKELEYEYQLLYDREINNLWD